MEEAVVRSCNIYFYDTCRRAGVQAFSPMIKEMGFGEKFELPFDFQRYGTVPESGVDATRNTIGTWQTYDTINMSIGQGNVLINPLQLAVAAARVASGQLHPAPTADGRARGRRTSLRSNSARRTWSSYGERWAGSSRTVLPRVRSSRSIMSRWLERPALRRSAELRWPSATVAAFGRTRAWALRDHALFMGFAPADNPRFASAAIIEHGGFGA